jgi:hypothetical protein
MKNSSLSNFILMSLLACMFFIACKKDYDLCEGKPDTEIKNWQYVGAEAMKLYPYKGNETLTFISNKGDTATLVGKGQLFQYPKLRYSGGDDCTNFYDEHAILFTEFVGDNPNFNHLRLEVFSFMQATRLKPYINELTGLGDYWNSNFTNLYGITRPELSNINFLFRDSIYKAFSSAIPKIINEPNYPKVIIYPNLGIIGYQPDSIIVYTLK